MSKCSVIFNIDGRNITVACQQNQQLKEICRQFETMSQLNREELIYYFNESEINKEFRFMDLNGSTDKILIQVYKKPKIQNQNIVNQPPQNPVNENQNQNNIYNQNQNQNIVNQLPQNPINANQVNQISQNQNQNINGNNNSQNIIQSQNRNNNQNEDKPIQQLSKTITCPKCHEKSKIKIKDYQITLYGCKNNHEIEDILLADYEETQIPNNNASNEWKEKEDDIKAKFYKFFININNFIKFLNIIKENMKIYYNIYNNCSNDNNDIDLDNFIKGMDTINEEFNDKKFKESLKIFKMMEQSALKINYIFDKNNKNKEINIFGSEFVKKNKDKCKIKYNNKVEELKEKLVLGNYNENKITLQLLGINKVTDMSDMFYDCSSLESFDEKSKWDTSKITNMSGVFYGCKCLKEVNFISKWNTSKVTDMSYMFYGCESLESLPDLSKWDTSKTTKMNHMFSHCLKLKQLQGISQWNTEKVINMENMFHECASLSSLPDISNWNTLSVIDMSWMFAECEALESIKISNWNTYNVKNMSYMFSYCKKLNSLSDISNWKTDNVEDMSWMFFECPSLTTLPDLNRWKINKVKISNHMFDGISTQILSNHNNIISRFIK